MPLIAMLPLRFAIADDAMLMRACRYAMLYAACFAAAPPLSQLFAAATPLLRLPPPLRC